MRYRYLAILLIAGALVAGIWAARTAYAASTVTVNEIGDSSDLTPGDGSCDTDGGTLGDQCTLRAAIEELNAQGPDITPHLIEFNITGGAGPFTITLTAPLPMISVPIVIDGETQPGSSCPTANAPAALQIVLDGGITTTNTPGLSFMSGSSGSVVRGLVIGNFPSAGISLGSDENRVHCTHVGLGVDGISDIGNSGNGVEVYGFDNIIGGILSPSQRNVISGNNLIGVYLHPNGGNTVVANNFLGTTADGLSALSNFSGISIGGDGNQIGGLQSLARNLVSGNLGAGIYLNNASGNLILGNEIGVARDGTTPLPNTGNGIEIVGGSITNTLGSPAPGAANLIANNGEVGIRVVATILGTPAQNSLRGNRIFNNGDLGIDLGGDGPDINDPGDGDTGENERQNYPVLLSATDSGTITGTLNSMPNTEYILDFYRNTDCDPAGYGEGEAFLGMGVVMTDNAGDAAFVVNVPSINLSVGDSVTATASDPDGNTSEFSACISVSASNPPTPTSTPSPGPSPTSTWTATAGASPTPTGTVTPTWTSTPGPSQTLTYTATAEPSPAPTLTGTPGPAPTGTPVPSDYPIYLPIVIR